MFRNIRNTSRFRHNVLADLQSEALSAPIPALFFALEDERRFPKDGVLSDEIPRSEFPRLLHSSRPFLSRSHFSPRCFCVASHRAVTRYTRRTLSRRPCDRDSATESESPVQFARLGLVLATSTKASSRSRFFLPFFSFSSRCCPSPSMRLIPSGEAVFILHPQ